MGGGCCQLKRDKELELGNGGDDKDTGESIPESQLQPRFEKVVAAFPVSSSRIKVNCSNVLM